VEKRNKLNQQKWNTTAVAVDTTVVEETPNIVV
jgi:hypothetical protein